jgi:hypothetical protein
MRLREVQGYFFEYNFAACPCSSADRVMDFESSGREFESHQGRRLETASWSPFSLQVARSQIQPPTPQYLVP